MCFQWKSALSMGLIVLAQTWALDNLSPSANPPGGLKPSQVPVFVVLGSDDNHDAVADVARILDTMQHADGSALTMSFYSNNDDDAVWTADHKTVWGNGHELALHSASHPDMSDLTREQISQQIQSNQKWMSENITIPTSQLRGFRTPFLSVTDSVLAAVHAAGLDYDCSVEDGWQKDRGAHNYYWPYTLDNDKHNAWDAIIQIGRAPKNSPKLASHPGLWEIPVYPLELIPDSLTSQYKLPTGWRQEVASRYPDADPSPIGWKITGFDYNLWYQFQFSPEELTALLQYNLDQRLKGNRAPLTFGIHANYYGLYSDGDGLARKAALETFVRNNAKNPNVRFVSAQKLIEWMRSPKAISPILSQSTLPSAPLTDVAGRNTAGQTIIRVGPQQNILKP